MLHSTSSRQRELREMRAKKARILAQGAKEAQRNVVRRYQEPTSAEATAFEGHLDSLMLQNVSLFIPEFNHDLTPRSSPMLRPPSFSKTGGQFRRALSVHHGGKSKPRLLLDSGRKMSFPMSPPVSPTKQSYKVVAVDQHDELATASTSRDSAFESVEEQKERETTLKEEDRNRGTISARSLVDGPPLLLRLDRDYIYPRPVTAPEKSQSARDLRQRKGRRNSGREERPTTALAPVGGISRTSRQVETMIGVLPSPPTAPSPATSTAFAQAAAEQFALGDPFDSPSPTGVAVVPLSGSGTVVPSREQRGPSPRMLPLSTAVPDFPSRSSSRVRVSSANERAADTARTAVDDSGDEASPFAIGAKTKAVSVKEKTPEIAEPKRTSLRSSGLVGLRGSSFPCSVEKRNSVSSRAVDRQRSPSVLSDAAAQESEEKGSEEKGDEESTTARSHESQLHRASPLPAAEEGRQSPNLAPTALSQSQLLQLNFGDFHHRLTTSPELQTSSREDVWLEEQLHLRSSPDRSRRSPAKASPSPEGKDRSPSPWEREAEQFNLYDETESEEESEEEIVDAEGLDKWRGMVIHASTVKNLLLDRTTREQKMRGDKKKKMLYERMERELRRRKEQKERRRANEGEGGRSDSEGGGEDDYCDVPKTEYSVIGLLWRDVDRSKSAERSRSRSPKKRRPRPPSRQSPSCFSRRSADRLSLPRKPPLTEEIKKKLHKDTVRAVQRQLQTVIQTPFKKQIAAGGKAFGIRPGETPRIQERISDLKSNGYAREQLKKKAEELKRDMAKEKAAFLATTIDFEKANRDSAHLQEQAPVPRIERIRERFADVERLRREKLEALRVREEKQQEERERLSLQRMRELDTAREMSRKEPYVDSIRKKLLVTIFFHARISVMAEKLRRWRLQKIQFAKLQRAVVVVQNRWRQKATDVTIFMRIKAMKIFRRNFWRFAFQFRLKKKKEASALIIQFFRDVVKSSTAVQLIRSYRYKILLIQKRFRDLQAIQATRLSLIGTQFDKVDRERVAELEKVWKALMQKEKDLQSQVAKREVERGRLRGVSVANSNSTSLMDTRLRKQQMNLAREINRLPNDVKQIPKVRSEFRQRIIRELLSYLKNRQAMRLKEYEAAMASLDENRRVKDIILNSLPKEALEARPDLLPPEIIVPPYPNFMIRVAPEVLQEALDRACEDARAHGSYYKRNATSSLLRHRRSLRPTNSRLDVSKAFEGGWEASRDVSPGGDEEEERERGRETAMDEDEEEAEERTTRNE